jgi:hypothetical protein
MDGLDREIVTTIQSVRSKVNSFVEIFLRVGEFMRNEEVLTFQLASHEAVGFDLRKRNRPLCKEVASILLDDNTGAKRDSFLHRRAGGLQRNAIDTMLTIHCNSFARSNVANHVDIEQFGIKVTPQTIKTTQIHVMSFPRTSSSSRPMNTPCCIALQDYFCARFPH